MRILAIEMLIIPLLMLTGCANSTDDRLVKMAQEHEARQAEQNRQAAEMHKQLVEGSRQLVQAEAKAREELTALQHDLRADQAAIGQQRDQLEAERRQIADQRHRDPLIAAAIMDTGLVLACLLPLGLAVYVLWVVTHSRQSDEVMTDFLVEELVTDQPKLRPLVTSPLPALGCEPDDDRWPDDAHGESQPRG